MVDAPSSSPSKQTLSRKRSRSVQFAPLVQVREFETALSNAPASQGPSLGLGWHVFAEYSRRPSQEAVLRKRQLYLSSAARFHILLKAGYTLAELQANAKSCERVHNRRQETLKELWRSQQERDSSRSLDSTGSSGSASSSSSSKFITVQAPKLSPGSSGNNSKKSSSKKTMINSAVRRIRHVWSPRAA